MSNNALNESNESRIGRALLGIFSTVVIILATFLVWRYVSVTVEGIRNESFEREVTQVTNKARDRVDFMVDTLYSLRGFLTVGDIDSDKWNNYLSSTSIEDRYPDYFSFAFVDIVGKQDIESYTRRTKVTERDNPLYESFFIFPKLDNAQVYPVRLLYTFDQDVALLLGYDVGSSPAVSSALIEAVRTGKPAFSEVTYLKLLVPSSDKVGYVVAMPVYSEGIAVDYPIEQRNKYMTGFVGVWIDQNKLFGGLSSRGEDNRPLVRYDVYDGEVAIQKGIFDDSVKQSQREISLIGKKFKIIFSGSEEYKLPFFQENLPLFTLITGLVIIFMWYGTLISILTARRRAVDLADIATKDLRKFKQAVDGVSDHVVITDREGIIVYANKAAERITGYSNKEMLGKRPSLWGKQMSPDFYKKMWRTIKEDKKPFYGQLTNKRKSGELYEAETRISPILTERGDLVYFVGIERDVTKIKALDRMKTEFISLASHQLRTPLSAVKWFGRMLLAGDAGKLSKLQKEYIENINVSNEREIQLVNSLLNISRIESGRIIIVPKPTNMKELIEQVVADAGISEDRRVQNIELKVGKKLPLLNIDPDLIRHVYMNLITNAMRYSDEGGRIFVEVEMKGKNILSSIEDHGIGIPKEEQPRIFERFFRAMNAMKKETEGTGLGLYLAKTIVESSGGKIWFESEVNKGSTFYFTLPLTGMKAKKGDVTLT